MDTGSRWIAVAFVLGLCAAYVMWGGSPATTPAKNTQSPPPASPNVAKTAAAEPSPQTPAPTPGMISPPPGASAPPPGHQMASSSLLTMTPATLDFGEVAINETKSIDVVLENTSTKPINVINVRGSCGCLKVTYPTPKTIPPGGRDRMPVSFTGLSGRRIDKASISITTDEGGTRFQSLTVLAHVQQFYRTEPEALDFETVEKGKSQSLDIVLSRIDGNAFEVKSVTALNKEFTFKWAPVPNGVRITTTATGLKAGRFTEAVSVVTDHPTVPVTVFNVSLKVPDELAFLPARAGSSFEPDGTVKSFSLTVKRTTPGKLEIENVVEKDGLPMEYDVERIDDSSCKLVVKLTGVYPQRAPTGFFLLTTNLDKEQHRVPYVIAGRSQMQPTAPAKP